MPHELSHVLQLSRASSGRALQGTPTINQPGDAFEQEAETAAERVMAGEPLSGLLTSSGLAVQRQAPADNSEKKPPEKKEAGEVIAEGLKTVAEQAADNNPQVKKVIIDPSRTSLKANGTVSAPVRKPPPSAWARPRWVRPVA